MVRFPAVAGSFYPKDKEELSKLIGMLIKKAGAPSKEALNSIAFIAPHAGYIYSGYVAAYTYLALAEAAKHRSINTFVIIGPNHMGIGDFVNVSLSDWQTPLGIAKNDIEFSNELIRQNKKFTTSEYEIEQEHSVEVQVPFIQYLLPNAKFAFLCMSDQGEEASIAVSKAVSGAAEKLKKKVIVIASSDFDHYEPASVAESKDMPAIHAIERLDEQSFRKELLKSNDTACGYGAIASAILYAKSNGASKGVLLKYGNSGYATKDFSSVVAYASIALL